jgi:hypothetical protein
VTPRHPLPPPPAAPAAPAPRTFADLSSAVRALEADGKDMPVLLRQYLKLNASLLGFSVDPAFGDALDGLLVVDLARVERSLLDRYLGRDGARSFLETHLEKSRKSVVRTNARSSPRASTTAHASAKSMRGAQRSISSKTAVSRLGAIGTISIRATNRRSATTAAGSFSRPCCASAIAASQVMKRAGILRRAPTAHAWPTSPRSMAALSGPASTTIVLLGETAADFFTKRGRISRQSDGAENTFQARERMRSLRCTPLEDVVALLARDHDRLAPIGGFAQLAKASLELGDCRFHTNQTI